MKKLLTISFIFLFGTGLFAQKIGVKLGGNFAGMQSSTTVDGAKMLIGAHYGLMFEKKIIPLISLRLEALYSNKGYTVFDEDNTIGTYDYKVNFDYLEVPLLAKVKLGPIYALAGPYFGYALNGTMKGSMSYEAGGTSINTDIDLDLFEDPASIKKTDYGLKAGLGLSFGLPVVPLKFFFEANTSIGMGNLIVDPVDDAFSKNIVFVGLSVGALIGF